MENASTATADIPTSDITQTILIVDDAAYNRALLTDMLEGDYNIIEASNGMEAVAAIQQHGSSISLMLLDIVMPEMDGFEVLAVMNKHGWINDIPVIMVSSEHSSSVVERAYELGVTDFINRPFDTSIVLRRVTNTLMLYAKQRALAGMVEEQVYERQKSISLMVSILSQIVEFRNGESGLHVLHVNTMTRLLLTELNKRSDRYNLTPEDIELITMASSLHDIGKIAIPEEILNKPGRFTDEEFEIMKQHSAIGSDMLKSLPNYEDEPLILSAYEITRWHHERYDGSGYPDGLKGDEIPISAQVVALADVYDALTSKRVYKDAYSHEKAVEMITNGECGAFDPDLLEAFVDIADLLEEEMRVSSLNSDSMDSAQRLVESSNVVNAIVPSARTLDLLEYERMKFNFYAMMSNEVQFEFTADPPVATISDYGTPKLGLAETIMNPLEDPDLIEKFTAEGMQRLHDELAATTMDDPIIEYDFQATIDGVPRWFHLAARAMWVEGEKGLEYRGAIGKLVDVHESRKRMSDLEYKATHDSLTGITNHAYARTILSERMEEDPDTTFVLMVMDMDKFKSANDDHGHMFGDEVLKFFAGKLRDSVRDNDIVARVGGDEFLIGMEVEGDPKPVVDRIYHFITGDEFEGFPISISMGVVCATGEEATYDDMFRSADKLLYDMKRGGRGGYIYGTLNDEKVLEDEDADSVISLIESDEPEEQ